jgi:arylsulfatase A-like enzyme
MSLAPLLVALVIGMLPPGAQCATDVPPRPNLVVILADDLGWGEIGVYGQRRIRTPNLDRMAAEGVRFTDFYAGAPVCAPTRSVLMTGQHGGRTRVRGNAGPDLQRLEDDDVTLAEVLRQAGYATALVGKWGLGEADDSGQPNRQGFDYFFGYLDQVHAHNYYPEFLWRNGDKVPLPNVVAGSRTGPGGFTIGWTREPRVYADDLIVDEALRWIRAERDRPFFLVLAPTLPHANNQRQLQTGDGHELPSLGAYADEPWPGPERGHAAMVSRLDADVGRVLAELRAQGIAERTLVLFTSDNGPHHEGGYDPSVFDASGPWRGGKRSLHDGGIRVPAIAWWPGTAPAGVVSPHPAYVGDVMATAVELAGVPPPAPPGGLWSVSLVPTLTGRPDEQRGHPYLYWESYERGTGQAVRFGRWKAVRGAIGRGPVALYDLERDPGERRNVAAAHPDVLAEAERYMEEAHVPAPAWTAHVR